MSPASSGAIATNGHPPVQAQIHDVQATGMVAGDYNKKKLEYRSVMAPLGVLWTFLITMVVFAVVPGPAVLYTAAQTVARGRKAGFMAALGIHVGGYVYVVAAALGLSALLNYVPTLYMAVKLAGAGYLIWLGIGMMRSPRDQSRVVGVEPKSARRAFVESVTVELLNPKTAFFFVAFLPQFVSPTAVLPVTVQFLILGVIVNLTFCCADLITVLLASHLVKRFGSGNRRQRVARVAGGSILVALGTRLAITRAG